LYLLAVLQKGFCLIGWKFRSPVLESDWGRHLLTYVLEDFSGGGDLDNYGFREPKQSQIISFNLVSIKASFQNTSDLTISNSHPFLLSSITIRI